ncbi:MAG: hypothetical protein Q4D16_22530 [Eubacteriales bacterium]|nr:hypothetical protein [Eubacteriales bacterium]
MKRKYAAVMLGLALTISSLNVYAAGTTSADTSKESTESKEDTTTDETPSSDTSADTSADILAETVSGEVKTVEEDSITISVGTLKDRGPGMDENREKPEGETPDGEEPDETAADDTAADEMNAADSASDTPEEEDTEETTEEEETQGSEDTAKDEKMPEEGLQPLTLELTGEEQTITITDETIVQREVKPELPEGESPDEAAVPDTAADSETEADDTDSADISTAAADEDTTDETADDKDLSESTADDTVNADDGQVMIDASAGYEMMGAEPIELSDIMEGDIVTITLDEDGNAAMITVLSQGEIEEEPMNLGENDGEEINAEADKSSIDTSGTDAAEENTADDSAE